METNNEQISLKNMGTVNKNKVVLSVNGKGTLVLFFSYETVVSFSLNSPQKYMDCTIENLWSTTTGKLLNECEPDKTKRLSYEIFNKNLTEAFNILYK